MTERQALIFLAKLLIVLGVPFALGAIIFSDWIPLMATVIFWLFALVAFLLAKL